MEIHLINTSRELRWHTGLGKLPSCDGYIITWSGTIKLPMVEQLKRPPSILLQIKLEKIFRMNKHMKLIRKESIDQNLDITAPIENQIMRFQKFQLNNFQKRR